MTVRKFKKDYESGQKSKKGQKCSKKRFDKIGAMFVIANAKKESQTNPLRRERRYYFCKDCKAYHVTSKGKNQIKSFINNRHK